MSVRPGKVGCRASPARIARENHRRTDRPLVFLRVRYQFALQHHQVSSRLSAALCQRFGCLLELVYGQIDQRQELLRSVAPRPAFAAPRAGDEIVESRVLSRETGEDIEVSIELGEVTFREVLQQCILAFGLKEVRRSQDAEQDEREQRRQEKPPVQRQPVEERGEPVHSILSTKIATARSARLQIRRDIIFLPEVPAFRQAEIPEPPRIYPSP